jgi:hypothetical protein
MEAPTCAAPEETLLNGRSKHRQHDHRLQQGGNVLARQLAEPGRRIEALRIGREFLQAETQARDHQLRRQRDPDQHAAQDGQRHESFLDQFQAQIQDDRRIEVRRQGVVEQLGHAVVGGGDPGSAPGA